MSRFTLGRFGWFLLLALLWWGSAARAEELRYHYVSLRATIPAPFLFFTPSAINDSGRVYGTLYLCGNANCDYLAGTIGVWAAGTITPRQPGNAYVANDQGTVGGSVFTDPVNFIEQAALFHDGSVELIPRQPGELTSYVIALNDSDTAVVLSINASYQGTWVLYRNGQSTRLDFGSTIPNPDVTGMNNQGLICGISFGNPNRGFRFDPRTGEATLLNPLPTEPHAWGVGINSRGDVLGWSFVFGRLERIGVWDHDAVFQTYFVEGTPQYPTVSNQLAFNDHNQIVISRTEEPSAYLKHSYLVPKPGVRLNLADLVGDLPSGANLSVVQAINNHGDMIGFDFFGSGDDFLLERVDATGSPASVAANIAPGMSKRLIPKATAEGWRRYHMSPEHLPQSGAALPQGVSDSLLLRVR